MADSQFYSRLLLSKGAGYPLWLPEPYDDLPTEYKETGVRIGDVGVITSDGAFDFVFNVCVPRDDPINSVGVPEDFELVTLGQGDVRRAPRHYSPGSDVSSAKLKKRSLAVDASSGDNPMIPAGGGAGFSISTSSREAAVLLLPDGGDSLDLRRKQLFRDYALKHADHWYRFLNIQLGRMIENGAIYLITGCDKATSWGVACFSQETSQREISLELKASIVASGHISYSWQSTDVSPVASRAGPYQPGLLNQAVFLRGYKVMIRERFAALRGPIKVFPVETAKPRDLLTRKTSVPYSEVKRPDLFASRSRASSQSNVDLESIPESQVYHPSDMINTLLLENMQEASVAVTHDAEWISAILQDESTIPDGRTLYRRLCDRYSVRVSEDGGVFFDSESSNNYNASPESSILGVLPIPHNESNAWHDSDVQSKKGRRWSIGSLLGSLGRRSAGGRSSRPLQLETQSDIDNPWLNNPATEETPTRTSLAIDEGLAIEKHSRSHLRNVRILLLGQSESGKSTFLRQFQRLYDPENFEKKRMSWRPVIQLNLISSIRTILSAVSSNAALLRLDSGRLSPSEESDSANSDPASMREGDLEFPITSHIENLADALLPLLELEDVVKHASTDENLSEHFQKALNFPGQLPNNAETALIPQELHVSSKEMETATQAVLHSLSGSMVRLWEDLDVQATLDAKMIRLEDSPGFFLNDLSRVTALDYVPADDDVMKARLETIGASEHKFEMKTSEYRPEETWSIIDVGGSRTQRHNWLSFFDQVDAIIFLAPMSCFDQYLREDSSVNRLEDSVALWKTICSNTILQRVSLILFLNKYDIFDRKLKSGIQLSKYLPSYKDRLNDVQTASSYLRSQFRGIHKRLSPSPRAYYSYFTSVTDAPSSVKIIGSVRDTVVRQNLTSSALI